MHTKYKLLLAGVLLASAAAAAWVGPKVLRRFDMQGLKAVTVAQGLDHPWALAFLPDGRLLVTERPGRMRLISPQGQLSPPLTGLPPVLAYGEGGLLDVVLDPKFAQNATLYWSYSEPDAQPKPDAPMAAGTAVARARLVGNGLVDVQVIFRQPHTPGKPLHFGSRLLFAPDGRLFVGLGDRFERADAQDPASAHGKLLRMEADGSVPPGNPLASQSGAAPLVWTYGHRNIQGLAFHPQTGELWATEHGPQGGDELNVIERGHNYGWPVITYGCEYETCAKIGEGTAKAGMDQPVIWWGPKSIAPSGMAFLTSDRYPGWKGQMFIGTLRREAVRRIKLDGHKVVEEEELLTGLRQRIRDVRQGPDGWLYVLTDSSDGRVVRMEPR